MNNDIKELMSGILKDMSALNYIKPGDVPNINLYMDQVTTFMYEHLHDTKRTTDDKVLTKTMINNYAKNNLLPSPVLIDHETVTRPSFFNRSISRTTRSDFVQIRISASLPISCSRSFLVFPNCSSCGL